MSDGWWSLTRPSSSHLTTASSSLARSTVPNSPFGFPKLPKPSTRSPGLSSWLMAEGLESGGLLARSESGTAPACDKGGWELYVVWVSACWCHGSWCYLCCEARTSRFAATVHRLDRYTIGLEEWLGRSKLHSSDTQVSLPSNTKSLPHSGSSYCEELAF